MAGKPVPDETRTRVIELGRTGISRNQVAREAGVSTATVTRICTAAGVTFDRSNTVTATEARLVDLKAERASMSGDLLRDAKRLQARIFTERDQYDPKTEQVITVERDGREVQALAVAVGILLDKHLLLIRTDSDDRDLPAVEVFVRGMGVPSMGGATS